MAIIWKNTDVKTTIEPNRSNDFKNWSNFYEKIGCSDRVKLWDFHQTEIECVYKTITKKIEQLQNFKFW